LVGGAMSCFDVGASAEKRFPRDDGGFPSRDSEVRTSEWTVATAPADLVDRRVDITVPPSSKWRLAGTWTNGTSSWMASRR
jgi:hypothetical protein